MILRKSTNLEEFVTSFTEAVLPAANTLRAISEGSICFTIQAENSSALEALWKQYQDGVLRDKLQEFLVTDEIKQLAGGEEVTVEVDIDEQDYRNAYFDLMTTEPQGNSEWAVMRKVMDKSSEGTHPTVKKTEKEKKNEEKNDDLIAMNSSYSSSHLAFRFWYPARGDR